MARRPQPWLRRGRGWYVQHNGRQVALGRDKKLAFERFHQLLANPARRTIDHADSFLSVCDAFLDWTQKNRAQRTYQWYVERLQSFVDHMATVDPRITADRVQPYHVVQWLNAHPKWGNTTRRASIIAVQRCFHWAQKMGYLDRTQMSSLEKPQAETRERVIKIVEYKAILAHSADEQFRDLVTTAWETGSRPQELLRIEARHVDFANSRWVLPPSEAKGKKRPRIIYLTKDAMKITRRLAELWPEGPIFRNTKGVPWTPYSVNCRFQQMKSKLGTKYCLYHFRHTFATRMLESGLDALTVALLLGHTNPTMLSTTYSHLAHNPEHMLQQVQNSSMVASA